MVECLTRDRGFVHGFESHWKHCLVSLSKTFDLLHSTGSTQEDLSRHNWKIVDCDVKNPYKQTNKKPCEFLLIFFSAKHCTCIFHIL